MFASPSLDLALLDRLFQKPAPGSTTVRCTVASLGLISDVNARHHSNSSLLMLQALCVGILQTLVACCKEARSECSSWTTIRRQLKCAPLATWFACTHDNFAGVQGRASAVCVPMKGLQLQLDCKRAACQCCIVLQHLAHTCAQPVTDAKCYSIWYTCTPPSSHRMQPETWNPLLRAAGVAELGTSS